MDDSHKLLDDKYDDSHDDICAAAGLMTGNREHSYLQTSRLLWRASVMIRPDEIWDTSCLPSAGTTIWWNGANGWTVRKGNMCLLSVRHEHIHISHSNITFNVFCKTIILFIQSQGKAGVRESLSHSSTSLHSDFTTSFGDLFSLVNEAADWNVLAWEVVKHTVPLPCHLRSFMSFKGVSPPN